MPKSEGIASERPDRSATRFSSASWRQTCLIAVQWLTPLIVLYSYILLRIEPQLLYYRDQALFPLTSDFFSPFLKRPGGIVAYLSAFFSTTFWINWIGSVVLTLLVSLIVLLTRRIFISIDRQDMRWLPLVPAFLILGLLGRYVHVVQLCVGLVSVLWLARVYLLFGKQSVVVRLLAFAGLSALAYYLAAGLYVVFAGLCGIYELLVKRSVLLGGLGLLTAVVIPLTGVRWFDLSFSDACGGLLPFPKHWLATPSSSLPAMTMRISLLLFFPVAVGLLAWRHRAATKSLDPQKAKDSDQSSDDIDLKRMHALLDWAAPSLLVVISMIVVDFLGFDVSTKCLLQMVRFAELKRWEDVLACYERVPQSDARALDYRAVFHVNRALYFTGDLPNRMFAYPQVQNGRALALVRESATTMAQSTPRQCSEILFDLGRINESEHMASEALEIFGDRPSVLKRLVQINVLKGRPEAARRFLSLMERSLFNRSWAQEVNRQLDEDPTLSGDPLIASRRRMMVQQDSIDRVTDLESMLQELLESNPRNQMAFEYLMAHYLLTQQLDKLVANLSRLDDFDYPGIPRYYEEAIVVRSRNGGSRDPDWERKVRPKTWQRYDAFVSALECAPMNNPKAAFEALRGDFGDSYFLFCLFGANR